jgi:hypothetical protein
MSLQATLHNISPDVATAAPQRHTAVFAILAGATGLAVTIAAIAYVVHFRPYESGKSIGYALGLTGGLLMLGLLLYPLRKRLRLMQEWGKLKYWFQFHMLGGIVGPVLVVFHSTFRIGSPNAAVAMACMFLVVASGLIGRFLYRKIHHGLYGSQLTLQELQRNLDKSLDAIEPQLRLLPQIRAGVQDFLAYASGAPATFPAQLHRFMLIGGKRRAALRRARAGLADTAAWPAAVPSPVHRRQLLAQIDDTLRAAQQAAQLSAYERLFSLWHVVHIPFLCMLAMTAVIHVVAVHVY